jgi:hypothetical protein
MRRRGFFGTVCGVVVLAGCSALGGDPGGGNASSAASTRGRTDRRATPSSASRTTAIRGGTESETTPRDTPTGTEPMRADTTRADATGAETTATETTGDERAGSETTPGGTSEPGTTRGPDRYRERFREGLADVEVRSLTVEDDTVSLTYVSTAQRVHELAAGIESITVQYAEVVGNGWAVDALEATAVDPAERPRGYWRVETDWVERLFAGDISRTELMERTLDTYRGDLPEDHDHTDEADGKHDDHGEHEPTTGRSTTHHDGNTSSDAPSGRH